MSNIDSQALSLVESLAVWAASNPTMAVYHELQPSGVVYRSLPLGIEATWYHKIKHFQVVSTPAQSITFLRNGHVVGVDDPAVVTCDGSVPSAQIARWGRPASEHPIFHAPIGTTTHLPGKVVLAAARGCTRNWSHWLLDAVPRILTAQEVLGDWNEVKILVNSTRYNWQRSMLECLGVPSARVVTLEEMPQVLADLLIVPSTTGFAPFLAPWASRLLQQALFTERFDCCDPLLLYVSRQHAHRRRVVNQERVFQVLKEMGFQALELETLQPRQQAELFASANAIIAPHGAGLANLVWCRPSTIVLEVFPPRAFHPEYWALAALTGLRYGYLLGEGDPPPVGTDPNEINSDITINVDKLLELFHYLQHSPDLGKVDWS